MSHHTCIVLAMKNKLRVRRAELDVTQFEIARKVGFDAAKLSRIENGLVDPSTEDIAALAKALKTTPAELFPGLSEQQQAGAR
jgi:transcriptional regulator with XRE-family HTH domain